MSTEMVIQTQEPSWLAPSVVVPIATAEQYQTAATALLQYKAFEKRVVEFFEPLKSKAYAAWKALTTKEKEVLEPARAWETQVKEAMAAYDTEQERLRQQEERRLAEEARKREEEERIQQAAALEAEGIAEANPEKVAEAEALLEAPVETPVVMVEKETPKVAGITYRTQYSAVLVDLMALCRHVTDHPEHQGLLSLNQVAANQLARSLRENMRVPGLKVRVEKVVVASR